VAPPYEDELESILREWRRGGLFVVAYKSDAVCDRDV